MQLISIYYNYLMYIISNNCFIILWFAFCGGKGIGRYFTKISVIGKCFFLLEVQLLLHSQHFFLLECCKPDWKRDELSKEEVA